MGDLGARLNLRAIRHSAEKASGSEVVPGVTRRHFLAITGSACIVMPSMVRADAVETDFTIIEKPGSVAFLINGVVRWMIDATAFDGAPNVSLRRKSTHRIRVDLRGALYPGTTLKADLRCDLWRRFGRWRMRLRMRAFDDACEMAFMPWLLGSQAAQFHTSRKAIAIGDLRLAISTATTVEMRPDWSMHAGGNGAITVTRRGVWAVNDNASIALVPPGAPSILDPAPFRRTAIGLTRGEEAWSIDFEQFHRGRAWSLDPAQPIDRLLIEAGSDGPTYRYALLGESTAAGEVMRFRPGGDLGLGAQSVFAMPLTDVRYALASDGTREQHSLLARFAPVTLALGKFAAHLDGGGDSAFELSSDGGSPGPPVVAPNVCGVSLASDAPSALVQTFNVEARSSIPFRWDSLPCELHRAARWITVKLRGSHAIWSDPKASILRPQDLLKLDFELRNFDLIVSHRRARAVRRDRNQKALLIVTFPPQHIAEEAREDTSPQPQPPIDTPLMARMAHESRLAFCVPDAIADEGIPWSMQSLMDWNRYPMHVVPLAVPPPGIPLPNGDEGCSPATGGTPREPHDDETSIEAPYHLVLSPHQGAGWAHSLAPVESRVTCALPPAIHDDGGTPPNTSPATCVVCINDGQLPPKHRPTIWERLRAKFHRQPPYVLPRTELWHTRLGVRHGDLVDENDTALRTVRAVWSPDYAGLCDDLSFTPFPRAALRVRDRCALVHLTTNDSRAGYGPIGAERVMLTSLGATLRLRGVWDQDDFPLNKYVHRAAIGRDEYVEVVQAGVLYPFGHPALFIRITERKVNPANLAGGGTTPAAYLHQRFFIQVLRRTQTYPIVPDKDKKLGRRMPFRSVTIDVDVTPNLVDPVGDSDAIFNDVAFWPKVLQIPQKIYAFPFTEDDGVNPKVSSTMPLLFVGRTILKDTPKMVTVRAKYNDSSAADRRTALFGDKKIAFAPGHASDNGQAPKGSDNDPSLETDNILFFSETIDDFTTPPPWPDTDVKFARNFYPGVTNALVKIPAVEHITPNNKTTLKFADVYVDNGFDVAVNRGEVYLDVDGAPPKVTFSNDATTAAGLTPQTPKGGAVATPDSVIAGLSRTVGAIQGNPTNPAKAVANIADASLIPADVFKLGVGAAKILGGIELASIIAPVLGNAARDFAKFPKLVSDAIRDVTEDLERARASAQAVINDLTSGANAIQAKVQAVQTELLKNADDIAAAAATAVTTKIENIALNELEPLRDQVLKQLATSASATEAQAIAIRRAFAPEFSSDVQTLVAGIGAAHGVAQIVPGGRIFTVLARLREAVAKDDPLNLVADVIRAGSDFRDAVRDELSALEDPAQYLSAIEERLAAVAEGAFNDARHGIEIHLDDARLAAITALSDAGVLTPGLQSTIESSILTMISAIEPAVDNQQTVMLQLRDRVLQAVTDFTGTLLNELKAYLASVRDKIVQQIAAAIGLPREIRIHYSFHPDVQDFLVFVASLNGDKATFDITTELRKSLLPAEITQPPTYSVEGRLRNFQIRLLENPEFIRVRFNELRFVSLNGSKPDIHVDINGIELAGGLSFIKSFQKFLDKLNPANGPFITLEGFGILAGFRFTLPPLSVGVFNLTNVSLSAAVSLPFTGDPARVRFGFADRQKRFLLSFSIFGGGGFFLAAVGVDGVEMIEGALELGAVAVLDLAVAHGEAHIMAGIYFRREANVAVLTGYVRAGGSFDVLGLISASIEFYMGLTMRIESGHTIVYGEAEVTVEIDILFFSASVHVYTRHEFVGSSTSGAELRVPGSVQPQLTSGFHNEELWSSYQEAFA